MRPAHIALDAHLLAGMNSYRSAGIHQYIYNLLMHLGAAESGWRYTVFGGVDCPPLPGMVVRRSALPTRQPLVRIFWEQMCLPLELRRLRPLPDLLHGLAFVTPLLASGATVVTVYDLSFRLFPNVLTPARRLYLSVFTAISCRRARRIIAISNTTRADVVRLLGIAPEKVDVVYPGVAPAFRPLPSAEVEAFRRRRGLPERFILYVGTLEPRKNLAGLIRAFALLQANDPSLRLVLAGGRGWLYGDLFRLVRRLGLEAAVIFAGFVPADELVLWYNAAAVFAYPSIYEGFGLPVVEALACGRPVVTSNVSSLPEAGGDAALLVPPDDVEALAAALGRALKLEPERLARGPEYAARFSWPAAAARTIAVYRYALAGTALSDYD